MGLREEKKAQARQTISNVATSLFLERGFDAVSVAEVAVAANVSKMTVFNYFPRKEDLFLDRGDEACAMVRGAVLDRAKGRSPVDALLDLGERLVAEGHPFALWKPTTEHFWRRVQESASLVARLRELREEVEEALASALVESAGRGADEATAGILAVAMVAAWRRAHAQATIAQRAGKRGDALAKVFLRELAGALEPVRRAAKGTAYGAGRR